MEDYTKRPHPDLKKSFKIEYDQVTDWDIETLLEWATGQEDSKLGMILGDYYSNRLSQHPEGVEDLIRQAARTSPFKKLENFVRREYDITQFGTGRNFTDDEINLITESLRYALEKHGDELRKDGSHYASHLIETAKIIVNGNEATKKELDNRKTEYESNHPEKLDYITMMGAFLHDVVEDTNVTLEELENHFTEYIEKTKFKDNNSKERFKKGFPDLMKIIDNLTRRKFKNPEPGEEPIKEEYPVYTTRVAYDYKSLLIKTADAINNVDNLEDKKVNFVRKGFRVARDWLSGYDALGWDNLLWRTGSWLIHKIPRKVNPAHYFDMEINFKNAHKIKTAWKASHVAYEAAERCKNKPEKHPYLLTLKRGLSDSIYGRLEKSNFHIVKQHMGKRSRHTSTEDNYSIGPFAKDTKKIYLSRQDYKALKKQDRLAFRRDYKWHDKFKRLEWTRRFDENNKTGGKITDGKEEIRRIKEYDPEEIRFRMLMKKSLLPEVKDRIDYDLWQAHLNGSIYRQTRRTEDNLSDGLTRKYFLDILKGEPEREKEFRENKQLQYLVGSTVAANMNRNIFDDRFAYKYDDELVNEWKREARTNKSRAL